MTYRLTDEPAVAFAAKIASAHGLAVMVAKIGCIIFVVANSYYA